MCIVLQINMADGGLPALCTAQPSPVISPAPPVQWPAPPVHTVVPLALPIQQVHMPQLSWLHFKSEFAGKPDEDLEAHLLRTNDWIDTHAFPEGVKDQHFCLTLIGEARFWYESLRPVKVDWNGLQNQFRQQYSKIGNTREQLFHAWRLCHFDENTERLGSYVTHIRQVPYIIKFLQTTGVRSFQEYTPYKIMLCTLSYRRFKTSSGNS